MMTKLLDDAKAAGFKVESDKVISDTFHINITEKLAKFAELQQPQWISVKDRLPEISDEYYIFGGFIRSGKWESQSMHWSSDINYNMKILKFCGLLHWIPLPIQPINQ